MEWKEKCFAALDAEKMFENSQHRTRFKELMDCFSGYPFFNKGVCKCVYLSAWDEKHFCIMLETLTEMSLGREKNTKEMSVKGDALAEEQNDGEYYVYQLSLSLLNDQPFKLDTTSNVPADIRYIIRRALKASEIIEEQ